MEMADRCLAETLTIDHSPCKKVHSGVERNPIGVWGP